MGSFGGFEWLIIILILIFFFGARKIPDVARGISRGIFEFKKASKDDDEDKLSDQETTER
jgi:sec-independent protein translocase protein TatA